MRKRLIALMSASLLVVGLAGQSPALAIEYEFPPGNTGYHTYLEMVAEVKKAADTHPTIVKRFSIGQSWMGRELWAVKISDNVAVDDAEPEVLFDGLHHGDEHMSLEMTLAILRWLTTGYGSDSRVTSLVNSREVYIVFAMNPDGATNDIRGRTYRHWRKNFQPTPGSSYIGTDLNRNYDYRWGCCGGSSTNPASSRYRGPSRFSAPETRALRDFVDSRVIAGRQQIRTAVSFHTSGRLILWPYGYTYVDIPADMTTTDHRTFVAMAKVMAASNGYKPEQASDLYISSGTSRDWLYGRHHIFSFTFELSPNGVAYAPDEAIPSETGRNRDAILYAIDLADCPYRAIGEPVRRCQVVAGSR